MASSVATAARPTTRGSLTGTIELNGCTLAPGDLTIRARWAASGFRIVDELGNVLDGDAVRPKTAINRTATITATADPHVLAFTISGLDERRLYQLSIRDRETSEGETFGSCGRLFWRGPFEGMARAGDRVVLQGFAARTQLEVLRPSRGAEDGVWVGADHLDLTTVEAGTRTFRWRTSLPAVQAGELQVSTEPFPVLSADERSSCAEPDGGIVYRQAVGTAESEWFEPAAVDLGAILGGRAVSTTDGPVAAVTPEMQAAVETGAPLWIRVVPLRQDGPACDPREDGVHGWTNVAKVVHALLEAGEEDPDAQLKLATGHSYDAPFFDPQGEPFGDQYAYLVTKPHQLPSKKAAFSLFSLDPVGAMLVQDHPSLAGKVLVPGDYIVIDPGEPGWWGKITSAFGSLVTGAIDAIGFIVDKVSQAYAEIKAVAVKVALDTVLAVPGVASACNALPADSCRKAVVSAIDAGLASMGMPPSLPNWNQLQNAGVDYLAAEMASQSGLPAGLTEAAAHELADEAMARIDAGRGSSTPLFNWLEPYFGFDPAVLFVRLTKTGGDLPPLLLLTLDEDPLFLADSLVLPRHWTGDLLVPIVMRPNVKTVAPPICFVAFPGAPCDEGTLTRHYRDAYRSAVTAATCANLQVMTRQAIINTSPPYLTVAQPVAALAVSMFTLIDEPAQGFGWNGKFAGTC